MIEGIGNHGITQGRQHSVPAHSMKSQKRKLVEKAGHIWEKKKLCKLCFGAIFSIFMIIWPFGKWSGSPGTPPGGGGFLKKNPCRSRVLAIFWLFLVQRAENSFWTKIDALPSPGGGHRLGGWGLHKISRHVAVGFSHARTQWLIIWTHLKQTPSVPGFLKRGKIDPLILMDAPSPSSVPFSWTPQRDFLTVLYSFSVPFFISFIKNWFFFVPAPPLPADHPYTAGLRVAGQRGQGFF